MTLRDARIDFEVFIDGAAQPVGAVRELHADHLIAWIENRGDTRIEAAQVRSARDGKVVLDPATLDESLREALDRAHDAEADTPSAGVSRE